MSVTMKDVAKLANVSVSTVSRVLNNSSLVKKETANKVREAIEKLNYQVNESARILRTNSSDLIGVIGAGMEKPFLATVLKGIETSAIENNYSIIYGDSDGEFKQEMNYLNLMKQKKIDGIIIISANIYTNLLNEVKENQIPIVFASGHIKDKDISCVTVDNVAAGYDVIEYLFKNNYENFGIIRGPYSDTVATEERMQGIRLAFKINNKELGEEIIVEGDFTFESGYAGAKELLSRRKDFSAIFAMNDEMAVGAMRYIEDSGREIPEDISVIGFDDIDLAQYVRPSLSTVSQSGYELGEESVKLLDKLIKGEKVKQNKIFIPHKLVLRDSTK